MTEQYIPNFEKYVPFREGGYTHKKLEGGITNESYKITPNEPSSQESSAVLTIFRARSSWSALDRENTINELVRNDDDIRIPKIIDSGIDTSDGVGFAFLLREYIEGDDLDTVLKTAHENGDKQTMDVIKDLGFRIGALHRHKAALYGLIGKPEEQHASWGEYIFGEIENEMQAIQSMRGSNQIGVITPESIIKTFPGLDLALGSSQYAFQKPESPALAHGDARFANFITVKKTDGWVINGIIDMEEAVGGDPGIDFAFIENWLHFTEYKDEFYKNQSKFINGYLNACPIDTVYNQRRLTYHVLRSLSYLRTIFNLNKDAFLSKNPNVREYVNKHFEILDSISKGNGLKDLDIKPVTTTS